MRRLATLVPVLALGACAGVSENDFIVEYELAYCANYVACATDEMLHAVNQRECLAWFRVQTYPEPPECPYDRKAAETCLEELAEAGCDAEEPRDPALPESCRDVYGGCRYPRLPRVGEREN